MLSVMNPMRPSTAGRALLAVTLAVLGLLGGVALGGAATAQTAVPCWALQDPALDDGRRELQPGDQALGGIEIVNACSRPVTVRLRTGGLVTAADGALAWSPEPPAGVRVVPMVPEVTVGAVASLRVPFTVTVPAGTTPGDYPFALGAAGVQPGDSPSAVDWWRPAPLRVSGPLRAAIEITAVTGHYRPSLDPFGPGSATVGFTVVNTGTVTVAGRVIAGLTGLYSRRVLPDPADLPAVVLVPGAAYHGSIDLPAVWPGVRFDAQAGFLPSDVGGTSVTFTEPGVVRAETLWAVPFAQLVLAVLLGSVLFFAALARRNRHMRRARETGAVTENTGTGRPPDPTT
ncbi:hypothetical protein ACTWPB_25760 [Nocardia sp. IBHARD005]|uniref:hypothetical protein n=1 Tax=Nocardia sp. IBHARD005 TaxID=3457765 RepID=UPI0040590858